MTESNNDRILLIDDTRSIHEDFRKILGKDRSDGGDALADAKAAFLGQTQEGPTGDDLAFEIDSAYQGQEGLELLLASLSEERPYAMAFVDVRMPPGWDGIQTIKNLWKADPELQVVICTAYSDYSWNQTIAELGQTDRLLILKKPFDPIEIRQLACALTEKWNAARRESALLVELQRKEAEARSYASSLELLNQALTTSQATSERASDMKSEYLVQLSAKVNQNLSTILETVENRGQADGLEEILDSSRHLMSALDRILDLAQLETGDLALDLEPCSIIDLTRDAVEARRSEAEAKQIGLVLEFPGALPNSVECDGTRYRQALDILLENSIQHTDGGSVRVVMRMEPTANWQRSRLRLQIHDSGPGVPDVLKDRLYEPFSSHGPHAGTGLGLALSRQLARCMGGDVTHESAADRGSVFTLDMQVGTVSGARMIGG